METMKRSLVRVSVTALLAISFSHSAFAQPVALGLRGGPAPQQLPDALRDGKDSQVKLSQVFDFDGDGSPEFMYTHSCTKAGYCPSPVSIWTRKDGQLVPYEHAPRALLTDPRIEDVDEDGRPDLLTRGPYDGVMWRACRGHQGKGNFPLVPEKFVVHSEADGTFSETNDTAQKLFQKTWCPEKPDLGALVITARALWPGGIPEHERLVHAVVCARVWGLSAKQVLSLLEPLCPKLPETGCPDEPPRTTRTCPQWLQTLVAITPRFALR